jgi:outer membrane protein assembly factor BamE (lipoprotein component of BamABCDE complex)
MNVYAPGFLYAPAFYGWAYNPWAAPITFGWGWAGSPWYGHYGGYFTPFPAYASPSLWLTDYLLAQTLQSAYQERPAELANAQANFTPVTPDVKQQIADEVHRQIALENSEAAANAHGWRPVMQAADSFSGYPRPPGVQTAPDPGSSGIARMLSDNMAHVFVVSAALDVQSNPGECSITGGDVLRLSPGARPYPSKATLAVLASKGQDCQRGTRVVVGLADLQDMQNHMRETLDLGLAELQKQQGQNGIPVAPAAAAAPPVQTAYSASAPPPDPNVAGLLSAQTKEADLTVGQTPDEVIAILGQPVYISNMGAQKIYLFNTVWRTKGLEVTFTNGKVSAARHPPAIGVMHRMPQPPPPQPKIEKGLTIDQVVAQLGQPQTIAAVGEKQIYLFKEWKITFIGGKVADIDVREPPGPVLQLF